MDINFALQLVEIAVAVILVAVLLLQVRGSGTTLFGQAESSYRSRRGVERLMFRSTIVLAGLFVVIAIVNVRLG
jgi:preprotein translocase subunit SecG